MKKPALKKPVEVDFEISKPLVPDEKWTFRWNGELITWSEYNKLVKEHEQWVKEQEVAAAAADEPEKKTRKRKT